MSALAGLEIWLFWQLGERDDRRGLRLRQVANPKEQPACINAGRDRLLSSPAERAA
jgi:hypothetical protein